METLSAAFSGNKQVEPPPFIYRQDGDLKDSMERELACGSESNPGVRTEGIVTDGTRCLISPPPVLFTVSTLWVLQLRYWPRSEKEETASIQRTVGNQTSSVLRGLRGSTYYYITVRAYNTAGTGPPGATVNVTTKKPRKPDCVTLSLKNTVRRDTRLKPAKIGMFASWRACLNGSHWCYLIIEDGINKQEKKLKTELRWIV